MSHERLRALTNDALLQRNVLVNLAAWALPAIAALVSIPILVRGLGPARFGLLTLAWATVGIGALTDFGLGRTLTRLVSVRLALARDHEVTNLVWTASWTLLAVTTPIAIAVWLLSPLLVDHFMQVPASLRHEAIGMLHLLAAGFPFMTQGVTLRGVLEAAQRFPLSARLRVPMSVVTYAGPMLAIPLGGDVRVAVGVIVGGRVLYWLAHLLVLGSIVPQLGWPQLPTRAALHELFDVGRWITLPAIVSPVLTGADRIVVASTFPIAASAWYGVAAELATKQYLFSGALQPVLYPALAASYGPAPKRAVALIWKATWITMLILFCSTFVLAAFAHPLLRFWMGSGYAPQVARVLPWISIAIFTSCMAQIPFAMLQGAVDPRRSGLLIVAELPVHLVSLVVCGHIWGLPGIAYATLGRMTFDAVGQWAIMAARFPASRSVARRTMWLGLAALVVLMTAGVLGAR